ncbi:MAG: DUF86 domain-containing protein [bacterium]
MYKRDFRLFLSDIKECASKIQQYVSRTSFEEFINTPILLDAVLRNLEIIGEASKNIPASIKKKYPQIEWRKISGLRDIVIHQYFGLDYNILWDVVQNKIPDLLRQMQHIIELEFPEDKGD